MNKQFDFHDFLLEMAKQKVEINAESIDLLNVTENDILPDEKIKEFNAKYNSSFEIFKNQYLDNKEEFVKNLISFISDIKNVSVFKPENKNTKPLIYKNSTSWGFISKIEKDKDGLEINGVKVSKSVKYFKASVEEVLKYTGASTQIINDILGFEIDKNINAKKTLPFREAFSRIVKNDDISNVINSLDASIDPKGKGAPRKSKTSTIKSDWGDCVISIGNGSDGESFNAVFSTKNLDEGAFHKFDPDSDGNNNAKPSKAKQDSVKGRILTKTDFHNNKSVELSLPCEFHENDEGELYVTVSKIPTMEEAETAGASNDYKNLFISYGGEKSQKTYRVSISNDNHYSSDVNKNLAGRLDTSVSSERIIGPYDLTMRAKSLDFITIALRRINLKTNKDNFILDISRFNEGEKNLGQIFKDPFKDLRYLNRELNRASGRYDTGEIKRLSDILNKKYTSVNDAVTNAFEVIGSKFMRTNQYYNSAKYFIGIRTDSSSGKTTDIETNKGGTRIVASGVTGYNTETGEYEYEDNQTTARVHKKFSTVIPIMVNYTFACMTEAYANELQKALDNRKDFNDIFNKYVGQVKTMIDRLGGPDYDRDGNELLKISGQAANDELSSYYHTAQKGADTLTTYYPVCFVSNADYPELSTELDRVKDESQIKTVSDNFNTCVNAAVIFAASAMGMSMEDVSMCLTKEQKIPDDIVEQLIASGKSDDAEETIEKAEDVLNNAQPVA